MCWTEQLFRMFNMITHKIWYYPNKISRFRILVDLSVFPNAGKNESKVSFTYIWGQHVAKIQLKRYTCLNPKYTYIRQSIFVYNFMHCIQLSVLFPASSVWVSTNLDHLLVHFFYCCFSWNNCFSFYSLHYFRIKMILELDISY